jgi:predicted site-specific integrase-resolvase
MEKAAYRYTDAAARMGVSPRTIRRWVNLEILQVVRVTQRTVFVSRDQVDAMAKGVLPWDDADARMMFSGTRS